MSQKQRSPTRTPSQMPGGHELAEIADRLRHAVAPALDLPHPDPEAVRLAALAEQIVPRAAKAEVKFRNGKSR